MACRIYESRPEMCKQFPKNKDVASEFGGCTFYMEGCRLDCRECCIDMTWNGNWERGFCRYSY